MLPGFNTSKREGVALAGTFTAKIDAEMRVGALEETITVTGETPLVDTLLMPLLPMVSTPAR